MPITLLTESHDAHEDAGVVLVNENTGELTLATQGLAHLLTCLDFSPVWQMEGIEDFVLSAKLPGLDEDGEEGEDEEQELLPGFVVAKLIDEADLVNVLSHYIDHVVEAAESGTLADKAKANALCALLDLGEDDEDDEDGEIDEAKKARIRPPYKKGAFKKMHKAGAIFAKRAVGQMMAMLHKGVIKRVKQGKGWLGGGYAKDKGYRKGGTPQGKKAYQMATSRLKSKISARKRKQQVAVEAADFDFDNLAEAPVWGLGIPIDNALFTIGLSEDAERLLSERRKAAKGKKGKAAFAFQKKKGEDADEEADDDAGDDDYDESVNESRRPAMRDGTLAGAKLAKQILNLHETARIGTHEKRDA